MASVTTPRMLLLLFKEPDGRTFSSLISPLSITPKQIPFGVFEIILFIDSSKITRRFLPFPSYFADLRPTHARCTLD
jgi:hypothetical protein